MGKKNKEPQEVEVTAETPQNVEITPYDNLYANQQNEQNNFDEKAEKEAEQGQNGQCESDNKKINLSFSINSLSSILAITSLSLTFLFAILACFNVTNILGIARGVFFMFTSILAIASIFFAYRNCNNKLNAHLVFSVLTVLITVIVYL